MNNANNQQGNPGQQPGLHPLPLLMQQNNNRMEQEHHNIMKKHNDKTKNNQEQNNTMNNIAVAGTNQQQLDEIDLKLTEEYQYQTNIALTKIQEYADLIKTEFLRIQQHSHEYRSQLQREYEMALQNNMVEMVSMRQQMYDLDSQYSKWLEQSQQELVQQAMQQQWQQQMMQQQQESLPSQLPPMNNMQQPQMMMQPSQMMMQKQSQQIPQQPVKVKPAAPKPVEPIKPEEPPKEQTFQEKPVQQEPAVTEQKPEEVEEPQETPTNEEVEVASQSGEEHYVIEKNERSNHYKPIPPFLLDLDSASVAPSNKKQTSDYYILYNPAFDMEKKMDFELHKTLKHDSVVCCVEFSIDGKMLATGSNWTTLIYDTVTGDVQYVLNSGDNTFKSGEELKNKPDSNNIGAEDLYIRAVGFSPCGRYLANGTEDKIIRIWDLKEKKLIKMLKGNEQDIYSLKFTANGKKLVSGSGDKTVRVWDVSKLLEDPDSFKIEDDANEVKFQEKIFKLDDGVTTVAISPDSTILAAGSLDRTIRLWDIESGQLIDRLDSENELGTGHKDSVYSIAFTHDGTQLVSGSLDRSIKLWDLKTQTTDTNKSKCVVTYTGHRDFVLSVATSNDDRFVFSGSKDRGIIVWDKESGNPLLMLQGHKNSVIGVAVAGGAPLGTDWSGVFATGSGDCNARIWKWKEF